MNAPAALFVTGLLGAVLWAARRIPLDGWRQRAVVACRLGALLAICLGLWGSPRRQVQHLPQRILYLVDGSASLDAAQRAWISRRISALDAVRPAASPRAVMAFGDDTSLLMSFDTARLADPAPVERALAQAPIDRRRTNLESALLAAASTLSQGTAGRVILFTDGRETSGSVAAILPYLRRLGVEVFPEPVPVLGAPRTVWERLSVPPMATVGSPVPARLEVTSAAEEPRAGEVTVSLHGVAITRQRVVVRPGTQVLTASVPTVGRGTMPLEVQLSIPGEGLAERRMAYIEVEGPPRVLLATDAATRLPLLAQALERRDIDVALVRTRELPATPEALAAYDAVMLFNAPLSEISPEQTGALRRYLESGGGLVTVGLGGDLAAELETESPVDALLPVRFEPKGLQEAKRRVCIILLVDRSASMLGPRIAACKRAAIALVKQLAPEDLVGILAFDTQPYVIAEVQPAGQITDQLVEKLVRLRSTGGTDIYPALAAAVNRLSLTDATVKHAILLSDGNTPFHEKAYDALIAEMQQINMSVSTIGVGAAFINAAYLRWLAESTGGTFYRMSNLNELPMLVVRDTEQAVGRLPFAEGYFRPRTAASAEWFSEVPEWPALKGYVTASARDGARVEVDIPSTEGDNPLIARWMVGQGRVASFTSDAEARWSPDWIRWPGFDGVWAQIMRWAMRPRLAEELFTWVDESRGQPDLVIEGRLENPTATLAPAAGGTPVPLSLVQTSPWRWQAALEQLPSGWYQVALTSQQEGLTVTAARWVQVGTPLSAKELGGQPPLDSVLQRIAQATGGVYQAPDHAFVPPMTDVETTQPVAMWWLPLVIVLLLAEVALRGSTQL